MNDTRKPRGLSESELDKIGHAISLLIQERYVWLFTHICRAKVLSDLDSELTSSLPEFYFFSEDDQRKGSQPIQAHHIMDLVRKDAGVFAYSTGEKRKNYDFKFVRELTRSGIRRTILVAIQSHLEHHRIEGVMRRNKLLGEELFLFIRQARNIICHANGVMDSDRLRPCSWRGLRIEKNGRTLRLSDQKILRLIDDAIEEMAKLYTRQSRLIDYVSLNLGYGIPYIQRYIESSKLRSITP